VGLIHISFNPFAYLPLHFIHSEYTLKINSNILSISHVLSVYISRDAIPLPLSCKKIILTLIHGYYFTAVTL